MNGALLSSCYIMSPLCCIFQMIDDDMRRGRPPFIGGEEGDPWNIPHPFMEGANRLVGAFNLPSTCVTIIGVRPHPRWATLSLILLDCLLWSPRLGPWWCCVELRCFDLGLALISTSFGPWFAGSGPSRPWAHVGWHLRFVSLHILSLLYAFPGMCPVNDHLTKTHGIC